jgi:hypothetical protein
VFGTAFNIVKVNKGNATVTGNPNWGNITRLDVTAFSTGAGTSSVGLEAIRIEDVDTVDSGYVMLARAVLATPFSKIAGRTQEIEFPLGVTIT